MKIVMSVFDDFSRNNGTTIRAKSVALGVLRKCSDTIIVTSMSKEVSYFPQTATIKTPNC